MGAHEDGDGHGEKLVFGRDALSWKSGVCAGKNGKRKSLCCSLRCNKGLGERSMKYLGYKTALSSAHDSAVAKTC